MITPNIDTFVMTRVEVLRGPQGTLYAATTLRGLLKFVANAPGPSGFGDIFQIGINDEPVYVKFNVASGKITKIDMKAVSPLADFSFDYRDLHFVPAQH
ncbi:MAG TPA: hypothetical protein VID67_11475 [Rhizomicrobium sp.]